MVATAAVSSRLRRTGCCASLEKQPAKKEKSKKPGKGAIQKLSAKERADIVAKEFMDRERKNSKTRTRLANTEEGIRYQDRNFEPSEQLGAMEHLGGYWDPLGLCKAGQERDFKLYRAYEIKHGRVAMMASVGSVFEHYVKFPGFEEVPATLGAIKTVDGFNGFLELLVPVFLLETQLWTEQPGEDDKEPGDYGDPLGLNMYTEDMRLKELNNGRFAMIAVMGIIMASWRTKLDAVEQLNAALGLSL